jgi:hypothetical protein
MNAMTESPHRGVGAWRLDIGRRAGVQGIMMPMTLHLMSPIRYPLDMTGTKPPRLSLPHGAGDGTGLAQRLERSGRDWIVLESGQEAGRGQERASGPSLEIPAGNYLFAQFPRDGNSRDDERVLETLARFGSGEDHPPRDIFLRSIAEDGNASIQVYWRVS